MVAISLYFGRLPSAFQGAGVAQLVEHHLAKVTVVSSSLITRSIFSLIIKQTSDFFLRQIEIVGIQMPVCDSTILGKLRAGKTMSCYRTENG